MTVAAALASSSGAAALVVLAWWLFRPETEAERIDSVSRLFTVPIGKKLFEPSFEWQPVEDHHVCTPGLEFQLDLTSGKKLARIPPPR